MSWEEHIPPLRAALIQPVDRNETYSASALYAGALVRELIPELAAHRTARQADRHGREPRRARDAARAHPPPEGVRRPVPPVGQLLPPALRQAGVELSALPADHALRRHGAPRRRRRDADPDRDDLRHRRGEPRQQPRAGADARRAGLPGVDRRGARRAQLDVLARLARTRTCLRCSRPRNEQARDRDRRRHGARVRPLRPAADRVPVRERRGLGLGGPRHGRRARAAARRRAG